jgi:RecJ-like exonuclease
MQCESCEGTGFIDGDVCDDCDGSGKICNACGDPCSKENDDDQPDGRSEDLCDACAGIPYEAELDIAEDPYEEL